MSSFSTPYQFRSIVTMLFIIGAGFGLGPALGQPIPVQASQTLSAFPSENNTMISTYDCMHAVSMRLPHCRGKLIWLLLKRWIETHIHWDTNRWGMPVYIEFDDNDRWQQVSLLCVHVIRRTS